MKVIIEYEGKRFHPYGPAHKSIRAIKTVIVATADGHASLTPADLKILFDKLGNNLEWAEGRVQLIEQEDV